MITFVAFSAVVQFRKVTVEFVMINEARLAVELVRRMEELVTTTSSPSAGTASAVQLLVLNQSPFAAPFQVLVAALAWLEETSPTNRKVHQIFRSVVSIIPHPPR
jgi:hypothetical protein